MKYEELLKSVTDKATKLKSNTTAFDLDFIAHTYLMCSYLVRIENEIPVVLTNIKQLIPLGAVLVKNYDLLRPELQEFIPKNGVPTKDDLDHRWVASLSLNMNIPSLKERVQETIKGIK